MQTFDEVTEMTAEQLNVLTKRIKMKKAPKRMFPNGLKTVAKFVTQGDNEITRKKREQLTRGVVKKFEWLEEKSYWDDASKSVKTYTIRVKTNEEREQADALRRKKGKSKFPLPAKERFF